MPASARALSGVLVLVEAPKPPADFLGAAAGVGDWMMAAMLWRERRGGTSGWTV